MDPQLTIWPAPAKLNLFLHINRRRDDGYHDLQSIFQILDYGDTLTFQPTDDGNIQIISNYDGVALEDNIIYKAATLLQKHTGSKKGCTITLHKVLPTGGGLGGGSSDAATTLIALNYYWQLGLENTELQKLGLQLGADVPVFVKGYSAFAQGVGEQLQPIELEKSCYLVVNPGVQVSTGLVFNHPDLPRATPEISKEEYIFSQTKNDCEALVCNLYPDIAKTLHRLLEYAPSRMTGTGACLFSRFNSEAEARKAAESLPANSQYFIASGVNISPVHLKLQELLKK